MSIESAPRFARQSPTAIASGSLELLDDGGDDHARRGAGDARLAVEHDGGGGGGALEDADDLVEAALIGRRVLVQRDPQRLDLFVL